MKRTLLLLLFLSLSFWLWSQSFTFRDPAFVAGLAPSGAASVYLIQEDCEGTGTPAGWGNINTVNWDFTGIVLDGTQSYCSGPGAGAYSTNRFGSNANVWAYCMVYFPTMPTNSQSVLSLTTIAGSTAGLEVTARANWIWRISCAGGNTDTATTYTNGVTNHIWVNFTNGINGVCQGGAILYVSQTPTIGSAIGSKTSAGATNGVDTFTTGNTTYPGCSNIIDKIRVSVLPIGSNPP